VIRLRARSRSAGGRCVAWVRSGPRLVCGVAVAGVHVGRAPDTDLRLLGLAGNGSLAKRASGRSVKCAARGAIRGIGAQWLGPLAGLRERPAVDRPGRPSLTRRLQRASSLRLGVECLGSGFLRVEGGAWLR